MEIIVPWSFGTFYSLALIVVLAQWFPLQWQIRQFRHQVSRLAKFMFTSSFCPAAFLRGGKKFLNEEESARIFINSLDLWLSSVALLRFWQTENCTQCRFCISLLQQITKSKKTCSVSFLYFSASMKPPKIHRQCWPWIAWLGLWQTFQDRRFNLRENPAFQISLLLLGNPV